MNNLSDHTEAVGAKAVSMLPAYIRWTVGSLFIAVTPLASFFAPFALILGLLFTLWGSTYSPKHRVLGAVTFLGLGALGFSVLYVVALSGP